MDNRSTKTIPKGWISKTVEQVFDFYPTATYSRDKQVPQNSEASIKYIHYGDIHTKYNILLDASNPLIPHIDGELKKEFELVKDGDLIIADTSEDYDGVGKCVEVVNVGDNQIISGLHTLMLRLKGDDFITGFKGYFFSGEQVRNSLLRIVTGIKVYSITKTTLAKVNLQIPSHQEQKAFVSILSKVDEAIASVQNSIASAERLKKSLMQNLLTGKMKADGTFRTPEEFYIDEKFGKVPVGWDCDRFKQFAVLQRGNDLTDSEVVPGNYPVIKSNGFSIWHNQYFVEPPGVVTGRSGTIGKVFYIEEKFWAHNTTLYVKDFKGNVPKYIYYLILSMDFSHYFAGTTVPTLNRNDIHKLKIAIPNSRTEQQQIVSEIDAIVNTIQQKRQKIDTLEHLKKSLMQNLLTGKIKINN